AYLSRKSRPEAPSRLGIYGTARVPPGGQGGRRAAAGKAGAADFPERQRVTEGGVSAAYTACPRSVLQFAAPASPAAARPPHDSLGAPRSLPNPTRDKVSRRFHRAGFAGRGTASARFTGRSTLASESDARQG